MKTIKLSEANKDFFEKVYAVVLEIPKGRVTSYGAIANYLGAKRSSRMVGWAMNASHKIEGIPAHRVVNRIGVLTGKNHFPDENMMQKKLESEGIQVFDCRVVDFNVLFWDPSKELTL
ncbi:MAG: MGMT family protein [Flavobacteriia bacterium]|jgi:methylated-DNA-protein-cysteine methyltransferase-like protein